MESVSLYFDLGSPYAYLAVARAKAVFGRQPDLEPVLLGAIFACAAGDRGRRRPSEPRE